MTAVSPDRFSVAAIQMVSTPVPEENIAAMRGHANEAAQQGAKLILLPEYWAVMGLREEDKLLHAEKLDEGPIQSAMSDTARELGVWLIGGTLPLISEEEEKVLNTTLVYQPNGERVSRYDKIHLFGFVKGDEAYDESRTIVAGETVSVAKTDFGKVGLSVCYDLRFPELYRAMGDCTLIVVPAAFTYTTGKAHWEVLLRARAIENQCYVLAAAQGGKHVNGRRTWGHSMLIDPWGEIRSELPEGEGMVIGSVEKARLEEVRLALPALKHRKM
jgi:predicted amidohydrolase